MLSKIALFLCPVVPTAICPISARVDTNEIAIALDYDIYFRKQDGYRCESGPQVFKNKFQFILM